MDGTFMSLLIVEAIVTCAAIAMFLYRGVLDMKEEDHIILDSAEAHLARDQAVIRHRVDIVTKYLKLVAVVWTVLLLAIFGVWVNQGLNLV